MGKVCTICGEDLLLSEFHRNPRTPDKLQYSCKACTRQRRLCIQKEKREGTYVSKRHQPRLTEDQRKQREEYRHNYFKQYRIDNQDRLREEKRIYMERVKLEGITAYGGKCSCCGEAIPEFLTLEHLEGRDPSKKKRKTGKQAWLEAKSEGYPTIYTVLCFNCNCAKGAFGECPHQRTQREEVC